MPLNGKGNVKGNRTNADILRREKDGTYTLIEIKLSKKSGLSTGQRRARKQIEEGSKKFQVQSKAPDVGLEKGKEITIEKHEIIYKYE